MLRSHLQRAKHFLALGVPGTAKDTFVNRFVDLWDSPSLKTLAVVQKSIIGLDNSMRSPLCLSPIRTGIASVLPTLRYSSLQRLGSYGLLRSGVPACFHNCSLHVSAASRQKPAMQAAAWKERPTAGIAGRPNVPGGPFRRPPHKKRRGPITERRSAPRSHLGPGD